MNTEPNEGPDEHSGRRDSRRQLETDLGPPGGGDSAEESHDRDTSDRAYRTRYDPGSDSRLSIEIVRGIARATGDEVTNIEPLYYSIDPELLDQFGDDRPDGGSLRFTYHDQAVEVTADGEITVEPVADNG